jgi:integrase
MRIQEHSASALSSASISLPDEEVIPLPTAKRGRTEAGTFTKSTVRKMHCSTGQAERLFWDASLRGFGMRALQSGRRSWIYQYRDEHGRTRRMALGNVSVVSLEAAREAARQKAASVVQGANPSVERKQKRTAGTVFQVIEGYLAYAKQRQRSRSFSETERHLRIHAAPMHHDRIETVRRGDIAVLLSRIAENSGPTSANRLRAALSAMWTWGLRTGLIDADNNPVAFTVRQPENSRDRTLNGAELNAIWAATDDGKDYSRIVRLCLLTGCRREEIGGLRWDEIHIDRIVFGPDRMKGNLAHEIALLPMISSALPKRPDDSGGCVFGRRGTGFSGWSKSKTKLEAKLAGNGIKMAAWGLHDLRRTLSTQLHDAGVEPLVIEALLAHKQQGVAAVYNRASFREAKSIALKRWHEILAGTFGTMSAAQ